MARILCIKPCVVPSITPITIPLMGSIKPFVDLNTRVGCDGCEATVSLFKAVHPFIMSLGMPLCLLGCAAALVAFSKTLQDSLGPPPDPTAIATAVLRVITKCKCVTDFALPPPAGPICQFLKFVRSIVLAIASALLCFSSLIGHIAILQGKAAIYIVDRNPDIRRVGDCILQEATSLQETLANKMFALGAIVNLLSPVFSLINSVISIPELNNLATYLNNFETAIAGTPPLQDVIAAVNTLVDALNVVGDALTAATVLCP